MQLDKPSKRIPSMQSVTSVEKTLKDFHKRCLTKRSRTMRLSRDSATRRISSRQDGIQMKISKEGGWLQMGKSSNLNND